MRVTYQASTYSPERVTGRYVRCEGRKPDYRFKVFEAATCEQKGQFFEKPGMGYTLREYETDGAEIPAAVRAVCIESKNTTRWD